MLDRATLEIEDLLKVALVLVIAWLVLEIVAGVLEFTIGLFGPLAPVIRPLLGLAVLVVIVLWLVDRA